MADDLLFEMSSDELLIGVYARQDRTLDDLPYTPEFERIYEAVVGDESGMSRQAVFHRLHNLRKAGKLPKLGRAKSAPPHISHEHETLLAELVTHHVDRLSLRDQLPFTDGFDDLVSAFNAQAALNLSPHDVWRIIAKLAK